jgi:FkbM family methyltransferase
MPKKASTTFEYEGSDLEAMTFADNYYRWIFSDIKPYIGRDVVEVGSGIGSFSKMILKTKPQSVHLIEPSKNTFKQLQKNTKAQKNSPTKVSTYNGYLYDFADEIKAARPDTFIYINVFEHIEDDLAELQKIKSLLKKNGYVIIFVPALQGLYSDLDKSIGHYRRYTKKSLRQLCDAAGLEVVDLEYRDMIGTVSWWLSFVVLKSTKLSPSLVKTYDKFFIPVIRSVESRLRVPFGKNLLLIAKKP